jgi:hypothetical protein
MAESPFTLIALLRSQFRVVLRSIGGGAVKVTPNGTLLSPPITGFRGMGLDGVGWGTAVTDDRVWISGFSGRSW